MKKFCRILLLLLACDMCGADLPQTRPGLDANQPGTLLLAHYMPWFTTKDSSGRWGWHWTMNRFDPEKKLPDGRRQIASHHYPLMGPYDSGDPAALECHAMLLKLAGFDGVVVDWYGIRNFNDYAAIHRNTQKLIPVLKRAGLKFAVCYEDQSVRHMVKAGVLAETEATAHGRTVFKWLEENWFADPAYVRVRNHPLVLVFGPQYFQRSQWDEIRSGLTSAPQMHALPHLVGRLGSGGCFGWPPVTGGKTVEVKGWTDYITRLHDRREKGETVIGVAFPGFKDIYSEAGLHDSYGFIDARGVKTFEETLTMALGSGARVVQVATWNDFGEGTVIEPTVENGYRHLEVVQRLRRRSTPGDHADTDDLKLPVELYLQRKSSPDTPANQSAFAKTTELIMDGKHADARRILAELKRKSE